MVSEDLAEEPLELPRSVVVVDSESARQSSRADKHQADSGE